jgi:hypothetical protein
LPPIRPKLKDTIHNHTDDVSTNLSSIASQLQSAESVGMETFTFSCHGAARPMGPLLFDQESGRSFAYARTSVRHRGGKVQARVRSD